MKKIILIAISIILMFSLSPTYGAGFKYPSLDKLMKIMSKDLNNDKKYIGRTGYAQMAIDHFNNNMLDTFNEVQDVFGIEYINEVLQWGKIYRKSIKKFDEELVGSDPERKASIIIGDPNRGTREERFKERNRVLLIDSGEYIYQGMKGYVSYASKYYLEDMGRTYSIVIPLLTSTEKEKLGWTEMIRGTVTDYLKNIKLEIRRLIFGPDLAPEYGIANWYGLDTGLPKLIDEFIDESKDEARSLIMSAITAEEKKLLGWISAEAIEPKKKAAPKKKASVKKEVKPASSNLCRTKIK